MLENDEIRENLKDAGCCEEDIEKILNCCIEGNERKVQQLITECRKKQLSLLHENQKRVDRLDYLSYQLRDIK